MHGHLKNSRSPAEILGLDGSDFSLADVHAAYKLTREDWEKHSATSSGGAVYLSILEEIEWAYREVLTELEIQTTPAEEDSILSAMLIPGLSSEAMSTLEDKENVVYLARRPEPDPTRAQHHGMPTSPLELPEIRQALQNSQVQQRSPVPPAFSSQGRRVKTLAGERDKAVVQTHARMAKSEEALGRLANIIETAEHVTGSLLRKLRQEMGVELEELALRTKIAKEHLESIEEDQYKNLPAVVYFRGFVVSYLRYIGLEREDIVDAITENYRSRKRMQLRTCGK